MVNLIDPFLTSMCVLRCSGLPRISDILEFGCVSSTTKSTSMKKSLILTGIFSAMPNGYRTD